MSLRVYSAEFMASFALVFMGAGSVIINAKYPGTLGLIGVAFAYGIIIMSMIYAIAHISGAQFNPAVTLAYLITKKIAWQQAIYYIIAQVLGSVAAGFLLLGIFPTKDAMLGTPALTGVNFFGGFLVEAILTFLLVFIIFAVAIDTTTLKEAAGIAIGFYATAAVLVGGNITGAALNPIRAFGPALASWTWANHLVYWLGPIMGAIAAALVYEYFFLDRRQRTI
jgi:MIP family channel proteins